MVDEKGRVTTESMVIPMRFASYFQAQNVSSMRLAGHCIRQGDEVHSKLVLRQPTEELVEEEGDSPTWILC